MLTTLLFPQVDHLRVDAALRLDGQVLVLASMTGRAARCPVCRRRSRQVHSRYERRLADLPCCGSQVTIRLRVRRFVCWLRRCPRHIFSEQLPALAAARARRTARAQERLVTYGLGQGGQPGACQAIRDGLPVSRRTLLRLLRATALPAVGAVRVLGVDDFSLRKGRTYATILVDLEARRPVDVLPDRTAETFAAWLRDHPEVQIISRDRASAYADGARQGAPAAQQVADRFHILKNLTEAVERYLSRRHALLRAAAEAQSQDRPGGPSLSTPGSQRPTRVVREQQARRACRTARYQEVCRLQQEGLSQREIARHLGLARETVSRYLQAEGCPERAPRAPRPTALSPFEPYLRQRWTEGCHNARMLWEEIRAQGFRGAASLVRRFLGPWRGGPGRPGPTPRTQCPPPPRIAPPSPASPAKSPRQATWLLLRASTDLDPSERAYRVQLGLICPEVLRLQALAQQFHSLLDNRDLAGLEPWIATVQESGIPELLSFVAGMQRDRAAADAAFTSAWSQGQTEGQVNRIKLLERSMYGRAKLDLLRLRVLHAA